MNVSSVSDETLVPKAPMVVSETLGGEAVIMHHGTGHYFNAFGTGALIWQAIENGATRATLAEMLQQACAVDYERAKQSVEEFVRLLLEHDLITTSANAPAAIPVPTAMIFEEPALAVHMDLADMLLLDPVHDVDEAGWPAPRPISADPGAQWPV